MTFDCFINSVDWILVYGVFSLNFNMYCLYWCVDSLWRFGWLLFVACVFNLLFPRLFAAGLSVVNSVEVFFCFRFCWCLLYLFVLVRSFFVNCGFWRLVFSWVICTDWLLDN